MRHIEQKARALGVVVGEKRKGLRNQLKSWWGSGSKSGKDRDGVVTKDGVVVQYRNNSIEFQIMQLADFQFLLRDYENALQHYKMANVDFKADNATAYMAATSEMIFYCLCMLGHGRREAELYSEPANQFYMGRSPDASPLLGARLALINSASLIARGNFNDAAGTLVAYSDEAGPGTHARAGFILEEAALTYLRKEPFAHYRRYMLRMVYAGHKYVLLFPQCIFVTFWPGTPRSQRFACMSYAAMRARRPAMKARAGVSSATTSIHNLKFRQCRLPEFLRRSTCECTLATAFSSRLKSNELTCSAMHLVWF